MPAVLCDEILDGHHRYWAHYELGLKPDTVDVRELCEAVNVKYETWFAAYIVLGTGQSLEMLDFEIN